MNPNNPRTEQDRDQTNMQGDLNEGENEEGGMGGKQDREQYKPGQPQQGGQQGGQQQGGQQPNRQGNQGQWSTNQNLDEAEGDVEGADQTRDEFSGEQGEEKQTSNRE